MKAKIKELELTFVKSENGFIPENKSLDIMSQTINESKKIVTVNGTVNNVVLLEKNAEEKTVTVLINNKKATVKITEPLDELLHSMGLDNALAVKAQDVKAPMPGLVLQILVEENTNVEKGDKLLILEAMKMENIIKAPAAGMIKKIAVKKGDAVDKNQLLIAMG